MKWIGLTICILGLLGYVGIRGTRNEPYGDEFVEEVYEDYDLEERLAVDRAKKREDAYVEEKRREEERGEARRFGSTAKGLRGI